MQYLNNKKPKCNFDKEDFTIMDFIAFMIYHSYVEYSKDSFIEGMAQFVEEDYNINLCVNGYITSHIDDYLSTPIQNIIFNPILPEFKADDFAYYMDDPEDEEEGAEQMIDALNEFFLGNKIPKKHRQTKTIKEFCNDCGGSIEVIATVVTSDYLRKIYKDKELRVLLESVVGMEFVKSNKLLFLDAYYQDGSDGTEYSIEDRKGQYMQLVHSLSKKFKKKRRTKQNKELAAVIQTMEIIEDISHPLKNEFETQTEVMF